MEEDMWIREMENCETKEYWERNAHRTLQLWLITRSFRSIASTVKRVPVKSQFSCKLPFNELNDLSRNAFAGCRISRWNEFKIGFQYKDSIHIDNYWLFEVEVNENNFCSEIFNQSQWLNNSFFESTPKFLPFIKGISWKIGHFRIKFIPVTSLIFISFRPTHDRIFEYDRCFGI